MEKMEMFANKILQKFPIFLGSTFPRAGWLLTDTHSPLLSDFAQTLSDLVKQSERGNPDDFVSFHFSIFSEVVDVYCT